MRITKQSAYAINWLASQGASIDTISKELNIPKKQLENYIIKNSIQIKKPKNITDLAITRTRDKGTRSVAIMTKEASQLSDEFRKDMKKKR